MYLSFTRSLNLLQRLIAALLILCVFTGNSNSHSLQAADASPKQQISERSTSTENSAEIEQRRKQYQEQAATQQATIAKRIADTLALAQNKYQLANKQKGKEPAAYVIALIDLAIAYRDNKEPIKASKLYSEAFSRYLLLDKNSDDERNCGDKLWQDIGLLPPNEFPEKFTQLFKTSEAKLGDPEKLTNSVLSAQYNQKTLAPDDHFDQKSFLKTAIDIRASIRGSEDSSLEQLLDNYARECEMQNDFAEAERAYRWKTTLKAGKAPDSQIRSKIQLAQFYVREGKFDQAKSSWVDLETYARAPMSPLVLHAFYELATEYKNVGRIAGADMVVTAMLNVGGDPMMSTFSRLVEELATNYQSTFNFKRAQTLLSNRVKASDTCNQDRTGSYARLQLSNLDYALGKVAESDTLFEQVKTKMALNGEDTTKLLADRNKMIEALKSKTINAISDDAITPSTENKNLKKVKTKI
jgi:hypothetical protein